MFVILTSPRTGSSHLVRLLDSHPNCVCIGEGLKPYPKGNAHPEFSVIEFLNRSAIRTPFLNPLRQQIYQLNWKLQSKLNTIELPRYFNANKCSMYIDWLRDNTYPKQVGIKIHIGHIISLPVSKLILKKSNIILLKRENLLRQYISYVRAQQTGIFATSNYYNSNAVYIDIRTLISSLYKYKELDRQLNALASSSENYLEISYERMIENWELVQHELLSYIGLPEVVLGEKVQLLSPFKKIANKNLNEDIENYEEVENAIKDSEFERFLFS